MTKKTDDSSTPHRETVILHHVPSDIFNDCLCSLNSKFTAVVLKNMVLSIKKWLSASKFIYVDDNKKEYPCLEVATYFIKKSQTKDDAMKLLATFLANEYNCRLMFDHFPDIVKEMMNKCLETFYVSVYDQLEVEGINLIVTKNDKWSRDDFSLQSPWFDLTSQYTGNYKEHRPEEYFICIPPAIFPYFYKMACSSEQPDTDEINPEEKGLHVFLTEKSTVLAYPIISNLYDQRELYLGSNGKIPISVIRNCARETGLDEFFSKSSDKEVKDIRATLLFPFMHYRLSKNILKATAENKPLQSILIDTPYAILPPARFILSIFLSHLSGLSYNKFDTTNCSYLVIDIVTAMMTLGNKPGWISVKEILSNILTTSNGYQHLQLLSPSSFSHETLKWKNKKRKDSAFLMAHLREELSEPFVKGALLMLASAGILDIAYRNPEETDYSYLDWLEYIRITPLGKYALGLSTEYKSKFEEEEHYFEADPDRLIIRSLSDKLHYENFISEVTKPIGNNRFVLTEQSFIRCCHTVSDLEKNISFLKNIAEIPDTDIWNGFFETLLTNGNPFKSLPRTDYYLFQVDSKNKKLIHLINTDAELKKYVIRAERFIVLVKSEYYSKFLARIRALGYII